MGINNINIIKQGSISCMSIYSGFATRQQQEAYDECLETVLYILQKRILRFYKKQPTDEEKFIHILNKLHTQMKSMEHHKYLQPKSSRTFQQLILFLKNRQLEQAPLFPQTQEISQSQLRKKQPLPVNQYFQESKNNNHLQEEQGRSQKLQQVKLNEGHEFEKDIQLRPSTTNNRIRKRISSKSNNSNPVVYHNSNVNEGRNHEGDQNQTKNDIKVQKFQIQNILNESAVRKVRASRNQPREYLGSQQQIKQRKPSKSRGRDTEEASEPQISGRESEVHNLIKGYINKTKRCYIKGLNKRKEEIEEMLRQI